MFDIPFDLSRNRSECVAATSTQKKLCKQTKYQIICNFNQYDDCEVLEMSNILSLETNNSYSDSISKVSEQVEELTPAQRTDLCW